MIQTIDALAASLRERFAAAGASVSIHRRQVTLELDAGALIDVATRLRDDADLDFAQLVDLCGVDYLEYGRSDWETSESVTASGFSRAVERRTSDGDGAQRRYAVVYHLLSITHNVRLRVRCWSEGEPPRVPSVVELWASADWYEREAFDLYGILFLGHPDLRRLLTDYGFIGHPFRKDFPLSGEVEMRYDTERGRVVYEPVSIEPRTLVPRVIRDDSHEGEAADA